MFKVIDIFAGPGGLGEGFSAFRDCAGKRKFEVSLSVEKDENAFRTLKLRAFFRHFGSGAPDEYYEYLQGRIDADTLFHSYPDAAQDAANRCLKAEIGSDKESGMEIRGKIRGLLNGADNCVLIGGPPCQAYSLIGRARNAGNPDYIAEEDPRQRLYVEYLQILADHNPAVFIMENVKGLLSATLSGQRIFSRILQDLQNPVAALKREGRETASDRHRSYSIYSLSTGKPVGDTMPRSSVVRAEDFGIPQSRHRVILLGVREDLHLDDPIPLTKQAKIPISRVIGGLPNIRSGLSDCRDSGKKWEELLKSQMHRSWITAKSSGLFQNELSEYMTGQLRELRAPELETGGDFIEGKYPTDYLKDWYFDSRLKGACNHSSRSHIRKDLYRYFFASSFAKVTGVSPKLSDFPRILKPDHESAKTPRGGESKFSDRFRVQLQMKPGTTVMSHISKDGHYYIHPDPQQCRSLTVREAARIQTFPDNYFFEGKRTAQYVQVGNAVPPYLALQIAEVVNDVLERGLNQDEKQTAGTHRSNKPKKLRLTPLTCAGSSMS